MLRNKELRNKFKINYNSPIMQKNQVVKPLHQTEAHNKFCLISLRSSDHWIITRQTPWFLVQEARSCTICLATIIRECNQFWQQPLPSHSRCKPIWKGRPLTIKISSRGVPPTLNRNSLWDRLRLSVDPQCSSKHLISTLARARLSMKAKNPAWVQFSQRTWIHQ